MIIDRPDRDALRVLFSESSRIHQLTLSDTILSWCDHIPIQGFPQLSELGVYWVYHSPTRVDSDKLSVIFSSAHRVNWNSDSDPRLVQVNGYRLHFLHLAMSRIPVTRVLEVLAACPNLRNADIALKGGHEYTSMSHRERILLPELRSLVLNGTWHLTCLLRSVQAPLLSCLNMNWRNHDPRECNLKALESFLTCSPHLEEIALHGFLKKEHWLISIITNNTNIRKLTVTAQRWKIPPITIKTFELLTRERHGRFVLPHLEKLVYRGARYVPDKIVLCMIESCVSPQNNVDCSSCSRRTCTLKSICLDRGNPMAAEAVARPETICQESGLEAEGKFASRD
ncbi:hypothetical protein PAXINDRAFT_13208 [Paxillus involutus ATCC 200175]|uniref:Uncharacterized protein n=1 Tax=Paxillus involutus ATCC 200175 TaxID=664439 RepID=A0A0C9U2T1_PAXIN|nr:hypothetical protein PAXINDRAFT_13208 [Paxillus involutus ATCC 200175]